MATTRTPGVGETWKTHEIGGEKVAPVVIYHDASGSTTWPGVTDAQMRASALPVSLADTITVRPTTVTPGTRNRQTISADTSVQAIASGTRRAWRFCNNSDFDAYLSIGSAASLTSYDLVVPPRTTYTSEGGWSETEAIYVYYASGASGEWVARPFA